MDAFWANGAGPAGAPNSPHQRQMPFRWPNRPTGTQPAQPTRPTANRRPTECLSMGCPPSSRVSESLCRLDSPWVRGCRSGAWGETRGPANLGPNLARAWARPFTPRDVYTPGCVDLKPSPTDRPADALPASKAGPPGAMPSDHARSNGPRPVRGRSVAARPLRHETPPERAEAGAHTGLATLPRDPRTARLPTLVLSGDPYP